jgi:hypothetical protein
MLLITRPPPPPGCADKLKNNKRVIAENKTFKIIKLNELNKYHKC